MQYLVFPAADNLPPTHKDPSGSLVRVAQLTDTAKVCSRFTPVTTIDGYTALSQNQIANAAAQAKATAAFNALVSKGITIDGLVLPCDTASRNEFTSLLAHLNNAGVTGNVTIADQSGALHTMTVEQFKKTIAAASAKYYAMWAAYQQQMAALAAS